MTANVLTIKDYMASLPRYQSTTNVFRRDTLTFREVEWRADHMPDPDDLAYVVDMETSRGTVRYFLVRRAEADALAAFIGSAEIARLRRENEQHVEDKRAMRERIDSQAQQLSALRDRVANQQAIVAELRSTYEKRIESEKAWTDWFVNRCAKAVLALAEYKAAAKQRREQVRLLLKCATFHESADALRLIRDDLNSAISVIDGADKAKA